MAGRLVVSTLNNDTGVLNVQNGMTGIAKAWLNYNGSTQTIRDSFNVSSVTRNATGVYTVNFTTAMSNANYSVSLAANSVFNGTATQLCDTSGADTNTPNFLTTAFTFSVRGNLTSAALVDATYACVSVFSS